MEVSTADLSLNAVPGLTLRTSGREKESLGTP